MNNDFTDMLADMNNDAPATCDHKKCRHCGGCHNMDCHNSQNLCRKRLEELMYPNPTFKAFTNQEAATVVKMLDELLNTELSGEWIKVYIYPEPDAKASDRQSKTHSHVTIKYKDQYITHLHNSMEVRNFFNVVGAMYHSIAIAEEPFVNLPMLMPEWSLSHITRAVQESLTPELKEKQYPKEGMGGYCYIATEAIYWLFKDMGTPFGPAIQPMRMIWEDVPHWYLSIGGTVQDITSSQFKVTPDYSLGKPRSFMTPHHPSKRARIVMDRAILKLNKLVETLDFNQ